MWLIQRRHRFLVVGESMLPTLRAGDSIFVEYGYYGKYPPLLGQIVLVEHPYRPDFTMVKRITTVSDEGVYVQGDNLKKSTDSRHFGVLSLDKLVARVWSRL